MLASSPQFKIFIRAMVMPEERQAGTRLKRDTTVLLYGKLGFSEGSGEMFEKNIRKNLQDNFTSMSRRVSWWILDRQATADLAS